MNAPMISPPTPRLPFQVLGMVQGLFHKAFDLSERLLRLGEEMVSALHRLADLLEHPEALERLADVIEIAAIRQKDLLTIEDALRVMGMNDTDGRKFLKDRNLIKPYKGRNRVLREELLACDDGTWNRKSGRKPEVPSGKRKGGHLPSDEELAP